MNSLKQEPKAFIDLNHYNVLLNFEPSENIPPKALKLFFQGIHHYFYERYENSAMYFNKAGKLYKNNPAIINNLGCIAYQNGNQERAKTLFSSILDLEQNSIHHQKALFNLGIIQAHTQEFDNATSYFEKISDNTMQAYCDNIKFTINLLQEQYQKADELDVTHLVSDKIFRDTFIANKLLALYKLKKYDEAITYFESEFKSIDTFLAKPQQEYALIANNTACNLYQAGKVTDAIKLFILAYSMGSGRHNKEYSLFNIGLCQANIIIDDKDVLSFTTEDIEKHNEALDRFSISISDHTLFYITPRILDENGQKQYSKPITLLESGLHLQALKATEDLYALNNVNTDLIKINHAIILLTLLPKLSKVKYQECIQKVVTLFLEVQKNINDLDKELVSYFYNNFACALNFASEKDEHFAVICNVMINAISTTPWQEIYHKNLGVFVIRAIKNSTHNQPKKETESKDVQPTPTKEAQHVSI